MGAIISFSENRPVAAALILVLIAYVIRILDIFVIRSQEWFGEQVVNKVLGLVLVLSYVWIVKQNFGAIGLHSRHWLTSVALGLVFMAVGVFCGYLGEWLFLKFSGAFPDLFFGLTSHPLFPEESGASGLLLVMILILGNVVNSFMEEGLFRGIVITHLGSRMSLLRANLLQASLFGLWHIVLPIQDYLNGNSDLVMTIINSLGYILLGAMIGFVWGTFYQKTNSLWASWSAHTLNNTTQNFIQFATVSGEAMSVAIRNLVIAIVMLVLLPLFRRMCEKLRLPEVETWV